MNQNVKELVKGHRDAITVKRFFGDAYERNGIAVIPAARVIGGGGGGAGESPGGEGRGSGTGFGLAGKPVGAFVIQGDDVTWRPAIDFNRIIAGAFLLVSLVLLTGRRRRRVLLSSYTPRKPGLLQRQAHDRGR